jgi:hypothetical protein
MSNALEVLHELPNYHPFALLACLPGIVCLYNLVAVWQSFAVRKESIQGMHDALLAGTGHAVASAFKTDLDDYRPRRFYTVCGAICLSLVFGLVAALSGSGAALHVDLGATYSALDQPRAVTGKQTTATNASSEKPLTLTEQRRHGIAGLVFAGYGAYLYTLTLCISRLFSSALTGKFMTVSALRSAIALVLGFSAGAINIFGSLGDGPAICGFFFIGLFPSWAMDALRSKAQEIFKARVIGVDFLPLRLVDGIDDGIGDRLAEIGLWDVQHMAAANPFALAARTLYPIRRVIDWMDQAILIGYVRQEIAAFRSLGIRGAIDFAVLFRDLMGIDYPTSDLDPAGRVRYFTALHATATTLFDDLSKKTNLSRPCLEAIGRGFYEDPVVDLLWDQWFKQDRPDRAPAPV